MIVDFFIKFRKGKLLSKLIHHILLNKGIDLPSGVIIGKNVSFPHNSIGTVIHPNTIIGNNVKIYQNVTIGRADIFNDIKNSNFKKIIIEDNVIICAGAKVISKSPELIIKKNCIIGCNAVLCNSTEENEIWAGVPARKLGMRN